MKLRHWLSVLVLTFSGAVVSAQTAGSAVEADTAHDPFISQGALGHFTWGVDLGGGVDLTSHDMGNFQFSACAGYKSGWSRFAGVGVELASMMNNSSRVIPYYAMVRTSFSSVHQFCFLELRAGAATCEMEGYKSQVNAYASAGLGFTLAHSQKFSSHIIVRGSVIPLKSVENPEGGKALNYVLGYGCIGIGCAF